MGSSFLSSLSRVHKEVDTVISKSLSFSNTRTQELNNAIAYSTLQGGKRLRPFLLWALGQFYKVPEQHCFVVGGAIEMVHAYSLVHDDLPCMDNAEYRRGALSCHKQYGESTAVLVGDALLPMAINLISDDSFSIHPSIKVSLIQELSKSIGPSGMVGGQFLDLLFEQFPPLSIDEVIDMYQMKTGRLFSFSGRAAGLLGGVEPHHMALISKLSENIGLMFQLIDDLLDAEGSPEIMGKSNSMDTKKNNLLNSFGKEKLLLFHEKTKQEINKIMEYSCFSSSKNLMEFIEYIFSLCP